jgi:hypothetical protein
MTGFIIFVVLLAVVTAVLGGLKATLIALAFMLVLAGGTVGLARLLSR